MGSIDPDGRAEINRRYYEKHKEDLKEKHREYWKTYQRRPRAAKPRSVVDPLLTQKPHAESRTRRGYAIWAWIVEAWERQGGTCYICQDPISIESSSGHPRTAHVDHDHTCCPLNKSCENCRRGLACRRCNIVLGMVNDDLGQLEMIAKRAREAWGSGQ